jgi:hypothetical protein
METRHSRRIFNNSEFTPLGNPLDKITIPASEDAQRQYMDQV